MRNGAVENSFVVLGPGAAAAAAAVWLISYEYNINNGVTSRPDRISVRLLMTQDEEEEEEVRRHLEEKKKKKKPNTPSLPVLFAAVCAMISMSIVRRAASRNCNAGQFSGLSRGGG